MLSMLGHSVMLLNEVSLAHLSASELRRILEEVTSSASDEMTEPSEE
jgi:hypothetical protein